MSVFAAVLAVVFVAHVVCRRQRRTRARLALADHHDELQRTDYFGRMREPGDFVFPLPIREGADHA